MWMIFIPIVFIGAFIVYQYVIVPKLNKQHEDKMKAATGEFLQSIRGKEAETKQQFIQNNEHIRPIVAKINEQDIEGIISCQEKREVKDFIRQQAINAAGKALGKITGVRVKEVDNTESYFLVLTNENLHYLHFSDSGSCKEHLSFQRNNLNNMEVGKITSADMTKNNAFVGDTQRLSFENEDTQYKFFFYDKIYAHPSARNNSVKEMAAINELFAKPFLDFTKQYRAN